MAPLHSLMAILAIGQTAIHGRVLESSTQPPSDPAHRPNILLIYVDDLGYNDLGCFSYPGDLLPNEYFAPYPETAAYAAPNQATSLVKGKRVTLTPHLDKLATEGLRLSNYHAPASVCSPSRAGLLTGALPSRLGISGPITNKFTHGISSREVTIPEMLKGVGYATAGFGKWHLGHGTQFDPTRHGFDQFPLSNGSDAFGLEKLTKQLIAFMSENENDPFFAYFAPHQPHHPMIAHPDFVGSSDRLFGKRRYMKGDGTTDTKRVSSPFHDVIHELDSRVGEILKAVDDLKLADNTLVIFTSDNGPWHGQSKAKKGAPGIIGSGYPYRGGKFDFWEGGSRVPAIIRFPNRIPAKQISAAPVSGLDWFKTFAHLANAPIPEDRKLDGYNLWPFLTGLPDATSPRRYTVAARKDQVQTISNGRFKLINKKLIDLHSDFTELVNVESRYPEIATELSQQLALAQADLTKEIRGREESSKQEFVINSGPYVDLEQGGNATLEVRLLAKPSRALVVNLRKRSGSESLTAQPAQLTFTPDNWKTPQSISVTSKPSKATVTQYAVYEVAGPPAMPIRELFVRQLPAETK